MGITVDITGQGSFRGSSSNVGAYSIKRDGNPWNAADLSGGTGEFSFDATEMGDSMYLYRSEATLRDSEPGIWATGNITSVQAEEGVVSLTVNDHLEALVGTYRVPPFAGTLLDALKLYLGIGGIDPGRVSIFGDSASRYVAYPGGELELWTWIKEILAVHQLVILNAEAALYFVSHDLYRFPLRNVTSPQISVQDGQLARAVEVTYYNNTHLEDELVYPAGGWTEDTPVYSVEAGETTEVDFELPVSVMWFDEPVAVDYVSSDYDGPTSVYAICGNDGLPVPPDLWRDEGGELKIELLEDTTTFRLTLTGPRGSWAEEYGPFRVAVASGSGGSNTYSSLRIVGGGIFMQENTVTCPTGVSETETVEEVGVTVENKAVMDRTTAYRIAVEAAQLYSGANASYSTSTGVLPNMLGGLSLEGLMVELGFANYWVRSTEITPTEASIEATPRTTFAAAANTWGSGTFADFQSEFSGLTFREGSITPLRRKIAGD